MAIRYFRVYAGGLSVTDRYRRMAGNQAEVTVVRFITRWTGWRTPSALANSELRAAPFGGSTIRYLGRAYLQRLGESRTLRTLFFH